MANVRVTQAGRNAAESGDGGVRVTQAGRLAAESGDGGVRVTQAGRLASTTEPPGTVSPLKSVRVQRVDVNFGPSATSVTLYAGKHYNSPQTSSNAFARVMSPFGQGGATANVDLVEISDQSDLTASLTVAKPNTGAGTYVVVEIIEYIGEAGGDNEWIVRGTGTVTIAASGTTANSGTIGSIADDNDVAVFLTGLGAASSASFGDALATVEWDAGNDQVTATRGVATSNPTDVGYAVIEFTGANWTVNGYETAISTARGNNDQTITAVDATDQAMIICSTRTSSASTLTHDLMMVPTLTSTTNLRYETKNGDDATTLTMYAFVISNSDSTNPMVVERVTVTAAGGANVMTGALTSGAKAYAAHITPWGYDPDVTSTEVTTSDFDDLGYALADYLAGDVDTSDAFGGNYGFSDGNTIALYRGNSDAINMEAVVEVVQWPGVAGNSSDIRVQRGTGVHVTTGANQRLIPDVHYAKPANSSTGFVRISAAYSQMFKSSGTTQEIDDAVTRISDQGLIDTYGFEVQAAVTLNRWGFNWEMWDYIGAEGGDNEFVVRLTETMSVGLSDTNVTGTTVPGVVTDADVVPIITGRNCGVSSATDEFGESLAVGISWNSANDYAELDRQITGNTIEVSVAVVEFTGAKWSVQYVSGSPSTGGTEDTLAITAVGAVDQCFTFDSLEAGTGALFASEVYYYARVASTTTVGIWSGPAADGANCVHHVFVVENTDSANPMSVQRVNGTIAATFTTSDYQDVSIGTPLTGANFHNSGWNSHVLINNASGVNREFHHGERLTRSAQGYWALRNFYDVLIESQVITMPGAGTAAPGGSGGAGGGTRGGPARSGGRGGGNSGGGGRGGRSPRTKSYLIEIAPD